MSAIKLFHSGQAGAPQLSGTNGSLITVLDAILVNGYNSLGVTSITRSGSVATVTCSANHGFTSGDSAVIAGADQPDYNGEFVVSVIGSDTFVITVTGTPATPATGTITMKRASANFDKVFSGSNKAAYRPQDASGTRPYLQVIDAGATPGAAKEAQIRGYLTMTDVDNGGEPFPTDAQYASGLYAYKSNASSAAARPWVLITDGKVFYFQACMDQAPITMQASGGYLWWMAFGDITSTRPGDPYSAFVAGCVAANWQVTTTNGSCHNGLFVAYSRSWNPGTVSGFFLPRSFGQNVGAAAGCPVGHGWDQGAMGSLGQFGYPHNPDNGLYITPVNVGQGGVVRGRLPGVYEPLQGRVLNQFDIVENIDGYPGRKFIALWGTNAQSAVTTGMLLFDLTGPWS